MTDYYYKPDELQHYGVLGMKWGVRRNSRVLGNHRRNIAVKDAKQAYRSGSITKEQKKAAIKKANQDRKALIKSAGARRTREEGKQYRRDIKNQTLSEVPHSHLKKGLTTVNKLLALGVIANNATAVGAASALMPAMAPLAISGAAVSSAAAIGASYLVQNGILDKIA